VGRIQQGGAPKHEREAFITWLEGYGGTPPWWVELCILADRWHIPPWELDEAPAMWVKRALYYAAKMNENEAKKWKQSQ